MATHKLLVDLDVGGTLTTGASGAGRDVVFHGDLAGEFFHWDENVSTVNIYHRDELPGLEVYVNGGAQTTQPQLKVGRSSSQYWGAYVDDRNAHLLHRQDETSGIMTTRFDQWDSNTSDTTGAWEWRFGDGSGSSMATALQLKQNGDLYMNAAAALYMDGGGDTYIQESAANNLLFATNGSAALTLNSSQNATFAGSVHLDNDAAQLQFGDDNDMQIFHDGGNAYFKQQKDDGDVYFQNDRGDGNVGNFFYLDGGLTDNSSTLGATVFPDKSKIFMGSGNDLRIYHDGTNSHFTNHTGDLNISTDTGDMYIVNNTNDKDIIFQSDSGSGSTNTYFRLDGSVVETRFHKSTRHYDNVGAYFGDSADLQIYHDGSNSFIVDYGTGDMLNYYSNDWKLIKLGTGELSIWATSDAGVKLYYDNSLKLETTSAGVEAAGNVTLNGDGRLLKFTPSSYDDVELGIDSNGFVIYNSTDARYDLKISGTGDATFGGGLTVGVDDAGHDVIFYGATSGKKMMWDKSADTLIVDGTLDVNGTSSFSGNADFAGDLTANQLNLKDGGDFITFYGGDETNHSISSRDAAGSVSDDLRINSYGALYINLDSNNNNTSAADFVIGRHGSATSTIVQDLLTLSGENGKLTINGEVEATSLDINGNADISGTLTVGGADAITIPDYILHASDDSKFGFPSNDNFKVRLAGSDVFTMSTTVMSFTGEVEGGSLDINGNADISGNLTGVDTLTATIVNVESGITHDGDVNNKIVFTTDTQTFSCDGNEGLILRGDAVTDAPLAELNGAGAGNQLNIGLLMKGTANGNPIKLKMQAPPDGGGSAVGAGIISYEPDADTFNIGQSTTHGNMAISINNDDQATLTNVVTLSGGFVLDGNTITGVDDSSEFTNDDAHIMTSAGIEDKILGYGYTTNTGDATLSGTQTFSGAKTFSAAVTVSNSTASSSKTTGAVKVTGGVGIQGSLNVGGDVTAFASSDERYKDNLQAITNPIDKVKSLTGYTFTWNDKHEQFNGNNDIGVVAQEVEKVLPEIVDTRDNGYKAVKYEKMVALLIEAIKDQQKQIEELKEKCNGCSR